MTYLVASLSTGKGSWAQVSKLIRSQEWEGVVLVTNTFGQDKFTPDAKTELVVVSFDSPVAALRDQILAELKTKIRGTEVAVNMCSGTGKEHTALVTAILRLGVGIRFVDYEDGFVDLS